MRYLTTYWLLSGQAWLACAAIVLVLAVLDASRLFNSRPRVVRAIRFVSLLAFGIAVLSGTTLPIWLAIPLAIASIAYLGFPMRLTAIAAAIAALVGFAHEARYFFAPRFDRPVRSLVIIGDSLASGDFGEEVSWPKRLAARLAIPVRSLARPSDTTGSALETQAPLLGKSGATILIELGGNDMLGDATWREYATNLDALLGIARAGGRSVVMLELPIPPGKWAYGAAQRRLARKHGVVLIPKRVLTRVLLDEANVVDGLHLTQKGHDAMADEVVAWIARK